LPTQCLATSLRAASTSGSSGMVGGGRWRRWAAGGGGSAHSTRGAGCSRAVWALQPRYPDDWRGGCGWRAGCVVLASFEPGPTQRLPARCWIRGRCSDAAGGEWVVQGWNQESGEHCRRCTAAPRSRRWAMRAGTASLASPSTHPSASLLHSAQQRA
jgi:hypothetical protein